MIRRSELLDRARAGSTWDLVVIGGGSTGLGTAVDSASRGYSTLLLEAGDFARGTSSRSTKLVHGGVRYLAQGNVALVREALHERAILLANAPHLVRRFPFVIPCRSLAGVGYYALGLKMYDLLAGGTGIGGSGPVGRAEALRLAPTLRADHLKGGVVYWDGQFDDARFAVGLARLAIRLGGLALNAMPVRGLIKEHGRIAGVDAVDSETGEAFAFRARSVVNATGVEVDAVRAFDEPGSKELVTPSRGSHLVLDRSFLPGDAAVMIPRTDDGRVLFAIPWRTKVILGTTDTPVDRVGREPRADPVEVGFLLDHAARYFAIAPGLEDVRSVFSGLRPLLGKGDGLKTSSISREHAVLVSDSGLVTITGGKWTTYRRMGRDAVDRAAAVAGLPDSPSKTESLKLPGWVPERPDGPFGGHGSESSRLEALVLGTPGWGDTIHPALPDRKVEVVWAAREEMARSVEDVLARRTRSLFLDARAASEAAPAVAGLLAAELGRDQAWERAQVESFRALASGYLPTC